uniref:Uncharacterized protein n=1 Tax=Globisporangium ultimum (strain ATCC 200006 / CBS 805.95 / DAOM BR144) TaxID=431595 RepID=K3WBE2_GLOUD
MKHATNAQGADLARAADDGRTHAIDASYGDRAESMSASSGGAANAYGAEKSLTPMTMDHDWDGYAHRKHAYGPQPTLGVLWNDRTPLNTPYTPQLVKLHLERHEEYREQQQEEHEYKPAKQLVSSIKSKVLNRKWILWYFTTVLSIPFALLLSPMLIAFSICTSPIWMAGLVVLVVRALMPAWNHPPLTEPYVRKASPQSGGGNQKNSLNLRHHRRQNGDSTSHPNSIYRHANLTTQHGEQDEG